MFIVRKLSDLSVSLYTGHSKHRSYRVYSPKFTIHGPSSSVSNIAFLPSSTPPHYSPCTPNTSVVYGYPPASNLCPLFPDTAFFCLENTLVSLATFNTLQALFEYPFTQRSRSTTESFTPPKSEIFISIF